MSRAADRAVIEAYIPASAWFEAHEMEPCVGEAVVPECALLLASPGDSIWLGGHAGIALPFSSALAATTRSTG